jgi:ubiquinone biosynthesis protein UbiJ
VTSAAAFANRALEGETWAREKLAAHAGKVLRIDCGPARITLAIDAKGRLAASDATPDLIVTIAPLRLPALLAEPSRWSELAADEGDRALAETLAELAPTLPWFVERILARVLGPVAAQPLADAGRSLLSVPAYAAERINDSFGRYLAEDRLAARSAELQRFSREVAALDERVDALAARVGTLER